MQKLPSTFRLFEKINIRTCSSRPPERLNFKPWRLLFVGPLYGTCFMSPFWFVAFWNGLLGFWTIHGPSYRVMTFIKRKWLVQTVLADFEAKKICVLRPGLSGGPRRCSVCALMVRLAFVSAGSRSANIN